MLLCLWGGVMGCAQKAAVYEVGTGTSIDVPADSGDPVRPEDSGDTTSNDRPQVETVVIAPAEPLTTDTLTVDVGATDPDGDGISLRLAWQVDGEEQTDLDAEVTADRTAKGQVWTVTVWASDDGGEGDPVTADAVQIGNSPPEAPAIRILPSAPTEQLQAIRCDLVDSLQDVDDDDLDVEVSWTLDDAPFADVQTTEWAGDTIAATQTAEGQAWTCSVSVSDGDASVEVTSDVVIVEPSFSGWGEEPFSLAEADQVFLGVGEEAWLGIAVSSAGDVDGDGLADVLLGAEGAYGGGDLSGVTYLFRSTDLFGGEPLSVSEAAWTFDGDTAYDYVGHSLDSAGDVDGDGLDDLLLTAHNEDTDDYNAGAVSVFLASELGDVGSHRMMSTAEYVLYGEGERSYNGFAVSRAGDSDADGLADVLIGAFGNRDREPYRGKAYLVRGTDLVSSEMYLAETGTMMWGEARRDYAGWSLASAGDVDGDGRDDALVGAPGQDDAGEDAGKAYLVLASSLDDLSEFELADADLQMLGVNEADWAGYAVAGPGDVNGDGTPDLFVGALQNDDVGEDAGIVYLLTDLGPLSGAAVSLSSANVSFTGEAEMDQVGRRVAAAGDVDGDGLGDMLAASTDADAADQFGNGCAYLLLGASVPETGVVSLADADARLAGAAHFDEAGWGLAGAGDVDGDGLDDILIGSRYHDTPVTEAGAAHLLLSR